MEINNEEDDSEVDSDEARDGMHDSDRDSGNEDTDEYEVARLREPEEEEDKTDSEDDVAEGEEYEREDVVDLGETVVCGADNDPLRKTWTRIGDLTVDERTEPHNDTVFRNLRIDGQTTEFDIFLALMPLKPADLLALVREGSDKVKDGLVWKL
jgi:hypothetical protein